MEIDPASRQDHDEAAQGFCQEVRFRTTPTLQPKRVRRTNVSWYVCGIVYISVTGSPKDFSDTPDIWMGSFTNYMRIVALLFGVEHRAGKISRRSARGS